MAITWELGTEEKITSGRTPSATITGTVFEAADIGAARALAISSTLDVYYGMLRTSVDVKRITTTDGADQGDFECVIGYGQFDVPAENEVRFSASTKGGREKVTQAIATFDSIGIDAQHPAADTGGAIGLSSDGSVSGVEIVVPKPVFSLEIHVDFSAITNAYWTALEDATGKTNDSTFYGREPEECLFMGADFDGTLRVDSAEQQLGRLRFDFAVSKSAIYNANVAGSGVTIQGLERAVSKRGWHYLDVRFGEFIDSTANLKVSRPISAHAYQVLPTTDFGAFGIGT